MIVELIELDRLETVCFYKNLLFWPWVFTKDFRFEESHRLIRNNEFLHPIEIRKCEQLGGRNLMESLEVRGCSILPLKFRDKITTLLSDSFDYNKYNQKTWSVYGSGSGPLCLVWKLYRVDSKLFEETVDEKLIGIRLGLINIYGSRTLFFYQ